MQRTTFQTETAAALAKAGFEAISDENNAYTFFIGDSPSEVRFKWVIRGTSNEILVTLRDNYAKIMVFCPSANKVLYKDENHMEPINTPEKVLEKARFAYRVGRNEQGPCSCINVRTKQVCGGYFVDDFKGGYTCSYKCWQKKVRRSSNWQRVYTG